jgi:hypothetical protein
MSRILTRPMFRKGGSTEGQGILSNVNRARYANGTNPDIGTEFKEIESVYDKYAPRTSSPMGPGTLPGFLTSFGLDLLSRPAAGSIFQTAAQSAQKPFQQFQAGKGAEAAEERALNRAILGDVMQARTDREVARIKATGEKGYQFKDQFELVQNTKLALYQLEDKLKNSELSPEEKTEIERQIDSKQTALTDLIGRDPLLDIVIKDDNYGDTIGEVIKSLTEELGRPPYPEEITKRLRGKAKGGRIGYEIGGEVETPMMNRTSSPVIAMDYTTLRARLPRQIDDSIVKLLAESEQALTAFASIRTQDDVDQFNQSYSVNLVLPQEA